MNSTADLYPAGSGNFTDEPVLYFPCRTPPYSKDSVSPVVWGILPELEGARWYVVAIEAVFLALGLTWNAFILLCYFRSPRLLKEPANIYLFNLAAVDILFLVFVTLTCLISEAAGEFVFGSTDFSRCIYCKFLGVVMLMTVSLSLHILAAMSVDRCVHLSWPMHYESIFNWKRALLILLLVWVVSIIISIPPLFGFGDYEYNLVFAFCNARWTGEKGGIQNIYYILLFSLESLIPIIVLLVMNVWIVKIVKGALKERIVRQRSFRNSRSMASSEESKYHKQQKQLMKVFGALFVSHIVCWAPVLTAFFVALGVGGAEKLPVAVFVACWLAFLTNPVVNPILETFFVKDLRYKMDRTRETVNTSIKRAQGSLHHQLSSNSLLKTLNTKHFSSSSLNVPLSPGNGPRRANTVSNLFADHNGVDSSCHRNGKLTKSGFNDRLTVPGIPLRPRRASTLTDLFSQQKAKDTSYGSDNFVESCLIKHNKEKRCIVSFHLEEDQADTNDNHTVILEQTLTNLVQVNKIDTNGRTEE